MTTLTKTPKAKKPVSTIEQNLPSWCDPQYWQRTVMRTNTITGKAVLPDTKPEHIKISCGYCGIEVKNNTFACNHFVHIPCMTSFILTDAHFKNAGDGVRSRCGDQKHCHRCCRCVTCVSCHRVFKTSDKHSRLFGTTKLIESHAYCTACKRCIDCCKCTICSSCEEKTSMLCPCGGQHHADCCDSEDRIFSSGNRILFIKRAPRFHEGENFQLNRCRRFLSIESEILNRSAVPDRKFDAQIEAMRNLNRLAKRWHHSVVPEGTVPSGFELCTAPASGDKFLQLVDELVSAYSAVPVEINERCGLHCHVDARDYSYANLGNFIRLYAKIEPAIFAMLPPQRRVSRFATPCAHQLLNIANAGDKFTQQVRDFESNNVFYYSSNNKRAKPKLETPKDTVIKSSYALTIAQNLYGANTLRQVKTIHKNADNQRVRYMALNLHSWVYRRTLEFRHFHGTLDPTEMKMWGQLCGTLVEAGKRLSIHDIESLPSDPVEALLRLIKPSSWISSGLHPWVQGMISKWSPDWTAVWPLIRGTHEVTPFKKIGGYGLRFDIKNQFYTYIPGGSLVWEREWREPEFTPSAFYARTQDLIAMPSKAIAYLKPASSKPPAKPNEPDSRQVEVSSTSDPTIFRVFNLSSGTIRAGENLDLASPPPPRSRRPH